MDKLTAIKVFLEVVDRGSLTAASDAMGISRAMTSRYILTLEKWLDIRLLQRSTRKLSITTAGQEVLPRFRQMVDISENLKSINDSNQAAPYGCLRVASTTALVCTKLSSAVTEYVIRYPETSIDLQLSERPVNLIEDRIDLAVRITNDISPGLIARKFADCHSVIVATPSYLQRNGTPTHVEELGNYNCLTHSYIGKNFWRFNRDEKSVEVAVTGNISTNNANALLDIVLAGAGISRLPLFLAEPMIKSGKLVQLFPDVTMDTMGLYGVYTSRKNMSALMRTFLDFLANYLEHESM